MNIQLEVINNHEFNGIPDQKQLSIWALAALQDKYDNVELSICLVDEGESAEFNERYRHKQGPTNILSFPLDVPAGVELDVPCLGDLILCVPLLEQEATAQGKALDFHWAHLVIHGVLHLQGFDHVTDAEADVMEAIEANILQSLNFPHPYLFNDNNGVDDE